MRLPVYASTTVSAAGTVLNVRRPFAMGPLRVCASDAQKGGAQVGVAIIAGGGTLASASGVGVACVSVDAAPAGGAVEVTQAAASTQVEVYAELDLARVLELLALKQLVIVVRETGDELYPIPPHARLEPAPHGAAIRLDDGVDTDYMDLVLAFNTMFADIVGGELKITMEISSIKHAYSYDVMIAGQTIYTIPATSKPTTHLFCDLKMDGSLACYDQLGNLVYSG